TCRLWSRASSRWTFCRASTWLCASWKADGRKSKISTSAASGVKATEPHSRSCAKCLKSSRENGAASAKSRTAAWGCASHFICSMPNGVSDYPSTPLKKAPIASAAKCYKASASRTNAPPLARSARRNIHWARRWFHRKAHVRRITATVGWRWHMVDFTLSCPVPRVEENTVLLAHGSGGRAMHRLLETLFLPAFSNPALASAHDGAVLSVDGARLAFTTDSYVVHPLFFPGGDIGALAVNGTVNDLAMCGACPLFLSAGFI